MSDQAKEPAGEREGLRERIAARAYGLYLERGGADGCDVDDWLEAERQVKGEPAPAAAKAPPAPAPKPVRPAVPAAPAPAGPKAATGRPKG